MSRLYRRPRPIRREYPESWLARYQVTVTTTDGVVLSIVQQARTARDAMRKTHREWPDLGAGELDTSRTTVALCAINPNLGEAAP